MIIGICGGTGSGKTTIARKIVESVGVEKVVLVEQDSYYIDLAELSLDERRRVNFDHPGSIDIDLIVTHLKQLKKGNSIEMPVYDFATHTRESDNKMTNWSPVIIIEGILIFSQPEILALLDLKVFVDTPADIRLLRRIRRDIQERGRTLEQTLNQYEKTIRPMHFEFVEPFREKADVIIPEGKNRQMLMNNLCSLIVENTENAATGAVLKVLL